LTQTRLRSGPRDDEHDERGGGDNRGGSGSRLSEIARLLVERLQRKF
jgi:hypothetical protein